MLGVKEGETVGSWAEGKGTLEGKGEGNCLRAMT